MRITVEALVRAPADVVWNAWNAPEHITKWNAANDDWHCPTSEVDLRVGGRITSRMEAKDGSMGFDFAATYTEVQAPSRVAFRLDDGRDVVVDFEASDVGVHVRETFDAEGENDPEMQRAGWQAILDNFARYAESLAAP